jgi:hypothetical protein
VIARILEILALLSALFAAWMWWRASSHAPRRLTKGEVIDHHDFNRLVTAINRSQLLNRRAALATAVSALAIALKYGHDLLQ